MCNFVNVVLLMMKISVDRLLLGITPSGYPKFNVYGIFGSVCGIF